MKRIRTWYNDSKRRKSNIQARCQLARRQDDIVRSGKVDQDNETTVAAKHTAFRILHRKKEILLKIIK